MRYRLVLHQQHEFVGTALLIQLERFQALLRRPGNGHCGFAQLVGRQAVPDVPGVLVSGRLLRRLERGGEAGTGLDLGRVDDAGLVLLEHVDLEVVRDLPTPVVDQALGDGRRRRVVGSVRTEEDLQGLRRELP